MSEEERLRRVVLDDEGCVVDNEHFFIKARVVLPIRGTGQEFDWTVWVSLSAVNFRRTVQLWDTVGREAEPPSFGWLSTELPYEPTTLNLKTMVHTQPVGVRPLVELEPTDHLLAIEQRDGITMDRVRDLAERILHPD